MRKQFLRKAICLILTSVFVLHPFDILAALQSDTAGRANISEDAIQSCTALDEAVGYLRLQMAARKNNVLFSLPYDVANANGGHNVLADKMMNLAVAYSDSCTGKEGDALKWSRAGYGVVATLVGGSAKFSYTINYHSNAGQEAALDAKVTEILSALSLDSKTDYEKVRAIHDWICDHVDYEYDTGNAARYSAYSAAVLGKSVCQGYAVLFYRLCKEAGLPVRIIGGTNLAGGSHGWNMVQIGNANARAGRNWYNVDCTWDGQTSVTRHTYFLKSDADFNLTHVRGAEYASDEYPAAGESYDLEGPAAGWNLTTDWDKKNILSSGIAMEAMQSRGGRLDYLDSEDIYQVKTDTSKNNKIYMFIQPSCPRSVGVATDINNNIAKFSSANVDVYLVSTARDDSKIRTFKSSMGTASNYIKFMYNGQALQDDWLNETIQPAGHDISGNTPIFVYTDSANKIQYASFGTISADSILANITKYCAPSQSDPETFSRITYHLDGGTNSPDNPIEYLEGVESALLSAPAQEGFTFKGWYLDSLNGDKIVKITSDRTGAVNLYAKWEENASITYMLDGGVNDPENPSSYTKGDNEIPLKNPTKAGCTFLGWYMDSEKTDRLADNKLVTTGSTGNVTLYVKWAAVCSITYMLDGGENDSRNPAAYTSGTDTITLYPAMKDGYAFIGWFKDAEKTEKAASITPDDTGDLTLYAGYAMPNPSFPAVGVSPSSDIAVMGVKGTYFACDVETVLAELNRIRQEACREGIRIPDGSGFKTLTEADYVPLKWSSDMEAIARQRALEAAVRLDSNHTRANGKEYHTAETNTGQKSIGENMSAIGGNIMNAIHGWYQEKAKWLDGGNYSETGHYLNLINPLYQAVGMSTFRLADDGNLPVIVTQELTSFSDLPTASGSFEGFGIYPVEVSGSYLKDVKINDGNEQNIKQGGSLQCVLSGTISVPKEGTILLQRTIHSRVMRGIEWTSSKPEIAAITASGMITAEKPGSAVIYAKYAQGGSASITVHVTGADAVTPQEPMPSPEPETPAGITPQDPASSLKPEIPAGGVTDKEDPDEVLAAAWQAKTVIQIQAQKKKAKISWKKTKGAAGYIIYYKTKKSDPWKKLKNTKAVSFTAKGLKSKSIYFFSVQPYKKKKGKIVPGVLGKAVKARIK